MPAIAAYNAGMSEFLLRPMQVADLPGVLAVQAQCYGNMLLESEAALASRLALSPATCWVAQAGNEPAAGAPLAAYLFTHAWPRSTLPTLDGVLPAAVPAAATAVAGLTWFVHDMAVAPTGRGGGLAQRLYRAAQATALQAGLHHSRLIAVQAAGAWWQRLGYRPLDAAQTAPFAAKLAGYGAGAVIMECALAAAPA